MTGSKGVTLVEALVTTAVVAVVFLVATQVLVVFFDSSSVAVTDLSADGQARQMVSLVSERTREGFVDYAYYPSLPLAPQQEQLAVRDLSGHQSVFWFFLDAAPGNTSLYLCEAELGDTCPTAGNPSIDPEWEAVNGEDVTLVSGQFFIRPATPPYFVSPTAQSNMQPLITVSLVVAAESGDDVLLQTSLTPRFYAR